MPCFRSAQAVANRSLCLELVTQRIGLELDDQEPVDRRDAFRKAWVARLNDLGIVHEILEHEDQLLLRPVDELTQDEVDDAEASIVAAAVLLWALGRSPTLPTAESLPHVPDTVTDHGVLGSGSVSIARSNGAQACLRPEAEIIEALRGATHTLQPQANANHAPENHASTRAADAHPSNSGAATDEVAFTARVIARTLQWILEQSDTQRAFPPRETASGEVTSPPNA